MIDILTQVRAGPEGSIENLRELNEDEGMLPKFIFNKLG